MCTNVEVKDFDYLGALGSLARRGLSVPFSDADLRDFIIDNWYFLKIAAHRIHAKGKPPKPYNNPYCQKSLEERVSDLEKKVCT